MTPTLRLTLSIRIGTRSYYNISPPQLLSRSDRLRFQFQGHVGMVTKAGNEWGALINGLNARRRKIRWRTRRSWTGECLEGLVDFARHRFDFAFFSGDNLLLKLSLPLFHFSVIGECDGSLTRATWQAFPSVRSVVEFGLPS